MITDPLTGKKGAATLGHNDKRQAQIYLQIAPGQSLLVSVFTESGEVEEPWLYLQPAGSGLPV